MKIKKIHEGKVHGELYFPFAIYGGKIPEYSNSYPLHWHEEIEIIYNIKGCGLVTIESEKFILNTGDIIVIAPETIHGINQYKSNTMEYFTILFKLSLLNESEKDICYEKYIKPIIEGKKTIPVYLPSKDIINEELMPYVNLITKNCNIGDSDNELLIKSCVYGILHILFKYSKNSSLQNINIKNTYDKLKKIFEYIETNYDTEITIKDASSMCGFSESHFMKIFKDFTRKSFTKYLKDYRLEVASNLLLNSDLKIIDIAEDTGFNNFSYFIRAFSKKYNVTPSEFRKVNKLTQSDWHML